MLLNDPTYVEAARALAERAIDAGRQVRSANGSHFAFRLATARDARPEGDATCCSSSRREDRCTYRQDQAAAQRSCWRSARSKPDPKLDPAELAAWTTVASIILNLDETITNE